MTTAEVVNKYVEAFNNVDIEELAELYHENAVNHQVISHPVIGRKAIREMLQHELIKTPMVCIVENIFESGEWAALEWKEPKGFRGCEIFHIKNGKIMLQRGYYDNAAFLKEHGL